MVHMFPFAYAAATPVGSREDPAKTADPADRSEQFVAVSGGETEQVNASVMVVAAYGAFWLVALLFVYLTFRNQTRLASRISELEKKLSKDFRLP